MPNCVANADWGPYLEAVKGNPGTHTYVYEHVGTGYVGVAESATQVIVSFYCKDGTELASLRSQVSTQPTSGTYAIHINCPPPGGPPEGAFRQDEG